MPDLPLPEALIETVSQWFIRPDRGEDQVEPYHRNLASGVLTAALAFRDESGDRVVWSAEEVPELWSCPECAFTFDAMHTYADGGHSCPCCAEVALIEALVGVMDLLAKMRLGQDYRSVEFLSAMKNARAALARVHERDDR